MTVETTDNTSEGIQIVNSNEFFEQQSPEEEIETSDTDNEDVDEEDVSDEDSNSNDNDENSEDSEDNDEEKPKEKKKSRYQERINELLARAREAELRAQKAEEAERRLAEKQISQQLAPEPTQTANLPQPDALNADGSEKYPLGEFDPNYIRDLNRAIIEEERARFRQEQQKEEQERQERAAREALDSSWKQKLAPIAEKYDDFIDKTLELESAFTGVDESFADYLVQTIKSLEHGPEVLYYFANNLEEARKVINSGPLNSTLALGELNAMFKKGKSAGKETKVSKAPPPPQVSTKGTSAARQVREDTDDLAAFAKMFFTKK